MMLRSFFLLITVLTVALASTCWGPAGFVFVPEADLEIRTLLALRLPRAMLAAVVGGGLAVAGAVLQSFFRNELASPFTIGISSMASLGACIALAAGATQSIVYAAASLAALFGMAILVRLSFFIGASRSTLLLIGICISIAASSGIFFLQLLSDPLVSFGMTRWLGGSFAGTTYKDMIVPSIITMVTCGSFLSMHRILDVIQIGDLFAESHGVSITNASKKIVLLAAVLTGTLVASVGPIGFIGLIIPNIVRRYTGSTHLPLLILSAFSGSVFLVLADFCARVVFVPQEIPIGLVTNLVGAPVFIWLILKKERSK